MKHILPLLVCVFIQLTAIAQPTLTIVPGSKNTNPQNMYIHDGQMLFSADDHVHQRELWSYDGNNPASMVVDNNIFTDGIFTTVSSNFTDTIYHHMDGLDGILYYTASDGYVGYELHTWDGVNNPQPLKNGVIGSAGGVACIPSPVYNYRNKIYFGAYTYPDNVELWQYDPVKDTVIRKSDMAPGAAISHLTEMVIFKDKLYFRGGAGLNGASTLYVYDAATDKVSVAPNSAIINGKSFGNFLVTPSKLYFLCQTYTNHGPDLYEYDGVKAPVKVTNIALNPQAGIVSNILYYNNKICFLERPNKDTMVRLTAYDIGAGTTNVIYDFATAELGGKMLAEYHGKLYFACADKRYNSNKMNTLLFSYDGVNAPQVIDTSLINPRHAIVYDNNLYFTAMDKTQVPFSLMTTMYRYDDWGTGVKLQKYETIEAGVYPNPAADNVSLYFTLKQPIEATITITDMTGKLVYNIPLKKYDSGTNNLSLDTRTWQTGIYNCTVSVGNELLWTGKLVKE